MQLGCILPAWAKKAIFLFRRSLKPLPLFRGKHTSVIMKLTTIILDMGGVVATLDFGKAERAFRELGVSEPEKLIDPYEQKGFFGRLEKGEISEAEFCGELGALVDRHVTAEEAGRVLIGFVGAIPERNLAAVNRLRARGYRLILLSNTNPFVLRWARSGEFDGKGNGVESFFDAVYASCECHALKPDPAIFRLLLERERLLPEETLFLDDGPRNVEAARSLGMNAWLVPNGSDWAAKLESYLV